MYYIKLLLNICKRAQQYTATKICIPILQHATWVTLGKLFIFSMLSFFICKIGIVTKFLWKSRALRHQKGLEQSLPQARIQ